MFFLPCLHFKSPCLLIHLSPLREQFRLVQPEADILRHQETANELHRSILFFLFYLWFFFIAGTIVVKSLFFCRDPSLFVCCE